MKSQPEEEEEAGAAVVAAAIMAARRGARGPCAAGWVGAAQVEGAVEATPARSVSASAEDDQREKRGCSPQCGGERSVFVVGLWPSRSPVQNWT